ncbi:hypothetical protein Microterr_00340 [Microbacterium terricola]|uniref:DUF1795 domain-containing protein n=1 Tax=Microbacterium terricola TaxID=344163 RepID=A0ABM8DUQ9_9MICO|nr:hypothetical protein Microterr_00340 [Microbacterium terricola]
MLADIPAPQRQVLLGDGYWDELPGVGNHPPPVLMPVRYGEEGIQRVAAEVEEVYGALPAVPHASNSTEVPLFAQSSLAAVKHGAFEEEQEWRLVLQSQHMRAEYRTDRRSTLVPYYSLSFPREAVREIWIGPDMHEGAEASLKRFLADHFHNQNIDVRLSDAPYRQ